MIRRHRTWLALVAVAVLAVAALFVAGSGGQPIRAYALDVPNMSVVAAVHPPEQACEGPIASHYAFQAVGVWTESPRAFGVDTVVVEAATNHQVLASSGRMIVGPSQTEQTPRLSRPVPADRSIVVCVQAQRNRIAVWGSQAAQPGVTATGVPAGQQFSLVLLTDPGNGSLLSWLPTAFGRAALWHPSWVGTWTFWLLAAALVAAFGVGVIAVIAAALADDAGAQLGGGEDGEGPSPSSSDGGVSDRSPTAAYP